MERLRYKSTFDFWGKTTLLLVLSLGALVAFFRVTYAFIFDIENTSKLLFLIPIWLFLFFYMRKKLLEINEITVTDESIATKNLITKRVKIYKKSDLKGYNLTDRNYQKIIILNQENIKVLSLYDFYYKDFNRLIENLGLRKLANKST